MFTSSDTFLLGGKAGKEEATGACSHGFAAFFFLSAAHFHFRQACLVDAAVVTYNQQCSVLLRKELHQTSVPLEGWMFGHGWRSSAAPYNSF